MIILSFKIQDLTRQPIPQSTTISLAGFLISFPLSRESGDVVQGIFGLRYLFFFIRPVRVASKKARKLGKTNCIAGGSNLDIISKNPASFNTAAGGIIERTQMSMYNVKI